MLRGRRAKQNEVYLSRSSLDCSWRADKRVKLWFILHSTIWTANVRGGRKPNRRSFAQCSKGHCDWRRKGPSRTTACRKKANDPRYGPQPRPGPQESSRNNSPYLSIEGPEQASIRNCDCASSGHSDPVSRQQRRWDRSNFCSQTNGGQAAVEHDQALLAIARPCPSSKHQSANYWGIHGCKPRKQRNNQRS